MKHCYTEKRVTIFREPVIWDDQYRMITLHTDSYTFVFVLALKGLRYIVMSLIIIFLLIIIH